jgi:hypothetical protein
LVKMDFTRSRPWVELLTRSLTGDQSDFKASSLWQDLG